MPGIKRDFYDVCPECWSVMVKLRTFKTPRYRCERCKHEFSNLKKISHDDMVLFKDLMKPARMELEQIKDFVDDILLRKVTVKATKEILNRCGK